MDLMNEFKLLYNDVYEAKKLEPTSREYDRAVSNFVSQYGSFENKSFFDDLYNIAAGEDIEIGYFAFSIIHTYYRRNKDYEEVKSLEMKLKSKYESNEAFDILHLRLEINLPSMDNASRLAYAKSICSRFPNNYGVLHDFSMMIAEVYEYGDEKTKEIIRTQYIEDGKKCIDAIFPTNYPKFLWTRARIYTILGGLEKKESLFETYYHIAFESIKQAWLKEEMSTQYSIRLATYRNCELYIRNSYIIEKSKREYLRIEAEHLNRLEKFRDELNHTKMQNIEILGLFVAVISFTIGSLNLISTETILNRIYIIIILMASILVVFGGLGIALHGKANFGRNLALIIIGCVIVAAIIFFVTSMWLCH